MDSTITAYTELFPKKGGNKSKVTRLKILEAAVICYAKLGPEKTTFDRIALEAGLTRSALFRYYEDYDSLFESAVKYVRIRFQEFAVERLIKEKTPESQLSAYTSSTVEWMEQFPEHGQFWLYFFFQCARQAKYRKLNSDLVDLGHARITSLLKTIQPNVDIKELELRAKLLQALITGILINMTTERRSFHLRELARRLGAGALEFCSRSL